ncbi:MAG: sodium:solute symporter family protein [Candidatus Omnitrophica bacterium]|nr:sodium:solute symporter family protein [Candidatus Omnitrophota bacterium]
MEIIWLTIYSIFFIGLGVLVFKRSFDPLNFFVAGKNNGIWATTSSLLATIIGSSAILGTVSMSLKYGWAAAWFLMSASIGLISLTLVVKKVNRLGKFTLPELLNDFYGPKVKFIASLTIPIAWTSVIAAQIIGSAVILNIFIGLSYFWAVVLSTLVFALYTFLGGQLSVIRTDKYHFVLILVGLCIICGFALKKLNLPLWQLAPHSFPFSEKFSIFNLLTLILTYSTAFLVGPDIYARIFCAKNEKVAQVSVWLSALILIPIAWGLCFIGVYANHYYPDIDSRSFAGLSQMLKNLLPVWSWGLIIIFFLSAFMSSANSTLLTSATILTDLFKNIHKTSSIILTRGLITLLAIFSLGIALLTNSIIDSLLLGLSFFTGAFVCPVLAGLAGWKINEWFVMLAVIVGGCLSVSGKIVMMNGANVLGNVLIVIGFLFNAVILVIGRNQSSLDLPNS